MGRKGSPYDPVAAKKHYLRALGKGSAKAALNLGWLWKSKARISGCRADDLRCMVRYFVQAAKMGSPDALFCLHEACAQGLGVPKDGEKAQKLLLRAAAGGSVLAMTRLGLDCIGRDKVKAGKTWLARALDMGHGEAGYHLAAVCYAVEQDVDAMILCLQRGAAHGSVKCIRRLALIHELGQFGQKVDLKRAEQYFRMLPKRKVALSAGVCALPLLGGEGEAEVFV